MSTVSFNTNFPGYDVLGEIGRSNARVLKARHLASGDLVAIKHFAINTDADTLRRFERESEIMTRMAHPNIVRVREVRLEADLPYIVLDYIEGGSVRQLLTEQGCLSIELTIRLGLQIINAFRLIHAEGIIHRDVKPENILYHRLASGELHFLLTDFGVARLHEQPVTMTGQSLMTYEYAAPEQFDNPRNLNESADYYALGVVLYECLTGKVPFAMRGETGIVTFMNAVLTTAPPTPVLSSTQPIPGSLATLIRQLLVKNPTERIHNPDEIRLALKQAEVEQLHFESGQPGPVPVSVSRTETYRPALSPVSPQLTNASSEPHQSSSANQPPARRQWLPIALVVFALVLAAMGAYWYANRATESTVLEPDTITLSDQQQPVDSLLTGPPEETILSPMTSDSDSVVSSIPLPATPEKPQTEAERQRYEKQVVEAMKLLEAETFGGKSGLLGGVRGLNVRLRNNSAITFKQVAVQVNYIKENGQILRSKTMYFNNIGPNASIVRTAPDSQRGTQFNAEVLRADAADPTSLTNSTPVTY
ncbi:serine/threonine-protein kinase [Fibrella aquatica]|uniref:serine/threonine-protein kinase n=1 Tax=Fibrella aquatica TaxID=3242487 RepID=UPI003520F9EF